MKVCSVCGKHFIPAPQHLYKVKTAYQCSYTCWNKAKPKDKSTRASCRREQG